MVEKMKQKYDYHILNYGDKKLIDKLNNRISGKLESKGMTKRQYVDYLFHLADRELEVMGKLFFDEYREFRLTLDLC